MDTLPVVDLSALAAGAPGREAALDRLRAGVHDVGFVYLEGHGVPGELERELLAVSRRFFALPVEARLEIENLRSPHFRGYTRVGAERTGGRADQREQIDIAPELPSPALGPGDPPWLRLHGPNLWPTALPGLRPVALAWMEALARVGREVLHALCASIGVPETSFDDAFAGQPHLHMKVVRYPGRDRVEGEQGVGAHKDYGFLSFLLLEPGTVGLQVAGPDGEWIEAVPRPGAYVVNVGELLEVATGGYLKATTHRVVSPPPGQDRVSLPFFYNPRLDAVVPSVALPPALAAQAGGVTEDPDNPILAAYGENALKGWLRAHPEVARRWWADVLADR